MQTFENCKRAAWTERGLDKLKWQQHGQGFVAIGDKPRIFLVEPFKLGKECPDDMNSMKPLCSDQGVSHFFKKWLDDADIQQWSETRGKQICNPKCQGFFHISNIGNDPRNTTMEGYNTPGFKYRVEYNSTGSWSCTCRNFNQNGANTCCKHINACIGVATGESRLGWPLETAKFVFDATYSETHLGLNDIVTEITPASATASATDGTTSKKMVPSFKQWSTRSI